MHSVLYIFALSLLCAHAQASGAHVIAGGVAGELLFEGDGAATVGEQLTLDFRQIANHANPSALLLDVVVLYRVRADFAPARLVVSTPKDFQGEGLSLSLDGGRPLAANLAAHDARRRSYDIPVTPGEHVLEVRYSTTPVSHPMGQVRGYGVDYPLWPSPSAPPADQRQVTILAPPGWSVTNGSTQPAMPVADDVYSAAFALFSDERGYRDYPAALRIICVPPLRSTVMMWVVNALAMLSALLVPIALVRWLRGRRALAATWLQRVGWALASSAVSLTLPVLGLFLGARICPHLNDVIGLVLALLVTWLTSLALAWSGCLSLGRPESAGPRTKR